MGHFIDDGDLVFVRQQPDAENGDKVAALINDQATVKEFHREEGVVVLMPKSGNRSHKPIVLADDFLIQGVVVGGGDCTIIHFPERKSKDGKIKNERVMMVDINHHVGHNDYENVIEYYKKHFRDASGQVLPIFRFVCSHPRQDHICGINELLQDPEINILNFWDLDHEFEPENFDFYPTLTFHCGSRSPANSSVTIYPTFPAHHGN